MKQPYPRDRDQLADILVHLVLKPIPTSHLKAADVDELTKTTRDLMLKELITLTESPLGQKTAKAETTAGEEDLAQLATARSVQR